MSLRTRARAAAATTAATRPARRVPTNLNLPADLVAEIDRIAGPRNRSMWVEEVVRKALKRERFRTVWQELAGSLSAEDHPHWRTSEDVVAWVREMRAEETDSGEDDA